MQTQSQRLDMIRQMLQDKDLTLTPGEIVKFGYYAIRYELAYRKVRIGKKQLKKYADLLNEDIDVFAFRKTVSKL